MFLDAVSEPDPPFTLLYIWGPAGIGKTTLMAELASDCDRRGIPALRIDARTVTPSAQGFLGALRLASPLHNAPDPWDAFRALPGRHVLFIDAFERLAPLVTWLRGEFLPQLEDTLVVLAGSEPLPPEWATDLGWQGLIRTLPLRNLSCEESSSYLLGRAVPEDKH